MTKALFLDFHNTPTRIDHSRTIFGAYNFFFTIAGCLRLYFRTIFSYKQTFFKKNVFLLNDGIFVFSTKFHFRIHLPNKIITIIKEVIARPTRGKPNKLTKNHIQDGSVCKWRRVMDGAPIGQVVSPGN